MVESGSVLIKIMVASHELQLRWVKALQPRPALPMSLSVPPATPMTPRQPASPAYSYDASSDDRSLTPVSFTSSISAAQSSKSVGALRLSSEGNHIAPVSRLAHSTGGSLTRSFDNTKRQSNDTVGLSSAYGSPLEASRSSPLRREGRKPGRLRSTSEPVDVFFASKSADEDADGDVNTFV